jgi:hypothetical protein
VGIGYDCFGCAVAIAVFFFKDRIAKGVILGDQTILD